GGAETRRKRRIVETWFSLRLRASASIVACPAESGETVILAIDIGGTKFTLAVFDGDRMVRRESRATDAAGGREWMLARIREIVESWHADFRFERCGIGFGGPVDFAAQRVVLSTHVGGWRDSDLCGFVRDLTGAPS